MLLSSSVMKGRHPHKGRKWNGLHHSSKDLNARHHNKDRKWKDLHLNSNLLRKWSSVEWNAEVIMELEECNVQIITNVEEEEMVKR